MMDDEFKQKLKPQSLSSITPHKTGYAFQAIPAAVVIC